MDEKEPGVFSAVEITGLNKLVVQKTRVTSVLQSMQVPAAVACLVRKLRESADLASTCADGIDRALVLRLRAERANFVVSVGEEHFARRHER